MYACLPWQNYHQICVERVDIYLGSVVTFHGIYTQNNVSEIAQNVAVFIYVNVIISCRGLTRSHRDHKHVPVFGLNCFDSLPPPKEVMFLLRSVCLSVG